MNNRFASEDQRAAEDDKQRQTAWLEDAVESITELEAQRDELMDASGAISD
jgi:hypothetical protein